MRDGLHKPPAVGPFLTGHLALGLATCTAVIQAAPRIPAAPWSPRSRPTSAQNGDVQTSPAPRTSRARPGPQRRLHTLLWQVAAACPAPAIREAFDTWKSSRLRARKLQAQRQHVGMKQILPGGLTATRDYAMHTRHDQTHCFVLNLLLRKCIAEGPAQTRAAPHASCVPHIAQQACRHQCMQIRAIAAPDPLRAAHQRMPVVSACVLTGKR